MEQRVRQVKEMLYNNEKNLGENTDNKINKPLIKQYNFGNAGQCYVNLLDGTFIMNLIYVQ